MRLYEFEGKQLFRQVGIPVPQGRYISKEEWRQGNRDAFLAEIAESLGHEAWVIKAQVLAGKRGKMGAIRFASDLKTLSEEVDRLMETPVLGQPVVGVLVETRIDIVAEHYLALTYDTVQRQPVLIIGMHGGVEVEAFAQSRPEDIALWRFAPDAMGLQPWMVREAAIRAGFSGGLLRKLAAMAMRMWDLLQKTDARLVEINPLARTADGGLVAVDAAMILDDDGLVRHPELQFSPRQSTGRPLTSRELAAKEIDAGDYRGVAGKYVEMDGDIGMLTMGGGGSITLMDAVIAYGGKPANYTEYGGNPPAEKVYRLTNIVATKPGLNGLLIAGGIANNTRIDVALSGIAQALAEIRPRYPIVLRQAGPGEEEGHRLMRALARRYQLDMAIYGAELPMTESARIIVEKAERYRQTRGRSADGGTAK